jgi:hypothetical protein
MLRITCLAVVVAAVVALVIGAVWLSHLVRGDEFSMKKPAQARIAYNLVAKRRVRLKSMMPN